MYQPLSILIPTHNTDCTALVSKLLTQAEAVEGLAYEIVVMDDGSTDDRVMEKNSTICKYKNCKVVRMEKSRNRSAMRNRLWKLARYDWQLQINANVSIQSEDFLLQYVSAIATDPSPRIIYGGVNIVLPPDEVKGNLRCKYEMEFSKSLHKHRKGNYFRNTNTLYHKDILRSVAYDESIDGYGYEDVLFGKDLYEGKYNIVLMSNPVCYGTQDSNTLYLAKWEEALRTLHTLPQLEDYSPVRQTTSKLRRMHLLWMVKVWHRLFGNIEKRNLTGKSPSHLIFKIYKLGYYSLL